MGGVGSREPVGRYEVVQPQCIESNLKGAEVKVAMRPLVATAGGRVGENGGAAVATGLDENRLGQLKIEVRGCFRGLIGDMRCMALWPPAFIPERDKTKVAQCGQATTKPS